MTKLTKFSTYLGAYFTCLPVFQFGGASIFDWLFAIAFVSMFFLFLMEKRSIFIPDYSVLFNIAILTTVVFNHLNPFNVAYLSERAAYLESIGIVDARQQVLNIAVVGIEFALLFTLYPLLISTLINNGLISIKLFSNLILLGALTSVIIGIFNYFNQIKFLFGLDLQQSGRISGLSFHANEFGLTCLMAIPLTYVAVRNIPIVLYAIVGILSCGLLLSGSRISQAIALPLIVICEIIGFRKVIPRKLNKPIIHVLIFVFYGVSLFYVIKSQRNLEYYFRFGANSANQSNSTRVAVAIQGVQDFARNPIIGIGFSAYKNALNIYIQLLATGGMTLFITTMIYWLKNSFYAFRKNQSQDVKLFASCFYAWLIDGFFTNAINERVIVVIFAILISYKKMRMRT